MHVSELREVLKDAYARASAHYPNVQKCYPPSKPGPFHKRLSEIWVRKLATALCAAEIERQHNVPADRIRAFFRGNDDFGRNEFLHDICIASTGTVPAALHNTELPTIRRVHWQVESEFSSDSRKAVDDFNKLVAGCGDNKLFVGPFSGDTPQARHAAQEYRAVLRNVLADAHRGQDQNWYLAVVPHPGRWSEAEPDRVRCWRFDGSSREWL